MKTIAFSIQKGGTGKTSTSGNTAFQLSRENKVIMVDTDPQGNLSSWFLKSAEEPAQYELADLLLERAKLKDTIIQLQENLFLLPTFPASGELKRYGESQLFQEPFVFDDLREALAGMGFDYCIYDLSPGMSQLEKAIILSCDEVITPLTPEFFATDGLETFTIELEKINKAYRREVKHTKIIANNYNKSFAQHTARMPWFESLNYDLFVIPQDRNIADSQSKGRTLFEHDPKSRAVEPFTKLAEAL